ncbi:MAG: hypothetical protein JWN44_3466 [Myxococcales bacterium]|nr:hypothetical protein [Myxococcales bacterium]
MWSRIVVVGLVLAVPFAAARAAPQSSGGSSDSSGSNSPLIQPPPGAKLIGNSAVDEIRAFPETGIKASLKGRPEKEKIVGIEGVDRVFQTDRSFGDTVGYFDQQFKQAGYQTMTRVEAPSATAWTIKRPDGTIANAVVRNTTPTTFELAEVAAAKAEIPNK